MFSCCLPDDCFNDELQKVGNELNKRHLITEQQAKIAETSSGMIINSTGSIIKNGKKMATELENMFKD